MKKITFTLAFVACLTLFNCKKEVDEKENVETITTLVNEKETVSQQDFQDKVFPLVDELYKKDSVKYRMINHIAQKAKLEKNKDFFKLNVANLKEEMKYIK